MNKTCTLTDCTVRDMLLTQLSELKEDAVADNMLIERQFEVIKELQKENAQLKKDVRELARALNSAALDINDYSDKSESFDSAVISKIYSGLAKQHLGKVMQEGDRFMISNTSGIIESMGTQSIVSGTRIIDTYGIRHLISEKRIVSCSYYAEPKMSPVKTKPFYTEGRNKKGGRKSW